MPEFDVVGVGLNATDTLLIVPHFPAYAGKVPFEEEHLSPGGQVASAMVACARLGLRAKYIGAVGDDLRGRVQIESLEGTGINLDHLKRREGCANQSAYIVIDRSTGERTVLWRRDDCLKVRPEEITEEMISCGRHLHIDGHDTAAVARAAEIARRCGIPVTVDVDTIYKGFESVLPNVDYLVASSEFPARIGIALAIRGTTTPSRWAITRGKGYASALSGSYCRASSRTRSRERRPALWSGIRFTVPTLR